MAPQFAVVTAALNDQAGLERTWQSIRMQSWVDWEWVVLDGGSSDDTVQWLATLDDARVQWRSDKDDGTYDAMNRGIALSRGDVVLFLNSSDTLSTPGVLDLVAENQHRYAWSWAYGVTAVTSPQGAVVGLHRHIPFRRYWLEWGYRSVPHPTTYITRELLTTLVGFDLAWGLAADQELIMRAARISRPGVIDEVLANFELGGRSSRQPPDAFVRQARAIRLQHKRPIGRSRMIDWAVTTGLSGEARLRARLSRAQWRQTFISS